MNAAHTHFNFFYESAGDKTPAEIQLMAALAPEKVCECSTCKEALDNAIRDSKEMTKQMCPASLLQYAHFLIAIAKATVACAIHENGPYLSSKEVLRSASDNCSEVMDQTSLVAVKYAEDIYNAGEEIAIAYLKRVGV